MTCPHCQSDVIEDARFCGACGKAASSTESVDLPYYLGKYPQLAGFWRLMFRIGFAGFVAPSVYFRTRCRSGAPER